jgi:hypothetical protein
MTRGISQNPAPFLTAVGGLFAQKREPHSSEAD